MIGSGALLDAYIEWEREFEESRRAERHARRVARGEQTGEWWASTLGRCYWTQLAKKMGQRPTRVIDTQTRRSFQWGELIEEFLRTVHYRCGIVKGDQVYLADPELSLSAKLDLVVGGPLQAVADLPSDADGGWPEEEAAFLAYVEARMRARFARQLQGGRVWAKELKSAKSYKMGRLVAEGPDQAWKMQVGAGMLLAERRPDMLASGGVPPIDAWVIEAVGRDAVGCLTFGATSRWREEARARVDYLNWALPALRRGATSLEAVPCECAGWMVEYCEYGRGVVARDTSDPRVTKWTVTFGCCGGLGRHTRAMRREERGA